MMAYPNGNLQDILRTLSAFTTPQPPPTNPTAPPAGLPQDEIEEGEYDPTSFNPNTLNTRLTNHTAVQAQPVAPVNSYPPQQPVQAAPPLARSHQLAAAHSETPPPSRSAIAIDARLITSWSVAMAHTRPLLSDDVFVARIRKLIKNQHLNERQWWDGRQALIKQQGERGQKRSELADVLKAVGGKVSDGSAQKATPEEEAAEITRYDMKIYRMMDQMGRGMAGELATLKVPFFCTKEAMVREDGEVERGVAGVDGVGATIVRSELVKLQRRMLDFLEVSCQE